jgi:guanylate cyclase
MTKFSDIAFYYQLIEAVRDKITILLANYLSDANGVPSILGEDRDIDAMLLQDLCELPEGVAGDDFHDLYRCASLYQLVSVFQQTAWDIKIMEDTYDGNISAEKPLNFIHMVFSHVDPGLDTLALAVQKLGDTWLAEYRGTAVILFATALVLAVTVTILVFVLRSLMEQTFFGFLAFLRRCPPEGVSANMKLCHYLLGESDDKAWTAMSTTKQIIHGAAQGIICCSKNRMIDTVNEAVRAILGFLPEQVLGQMIDIVLGKEAQEKVTRQMEMMIRHECAKTFTETLICINEDDAPVTCEVTLLGMTVEGRRDVQSFVVMIKDVAKLRAHQEEAAKAKARSEQLLFEILPRDIANRIAAGETDIAMVVKCATIFFIDIDKFSSFCFELQPQQIMGTLQTIFVALDDLVPKHELVMRVKYTGDIWMGAAGLFGEHKPVAHAEQAIRLSLEALTVMEDVNAKLEANLRVRVGINTGGPVISGILGTDKPMFDIIGDPINIAARLQTSGAPGRIQISEDTYEVVKDSGFVIEERGLVFLKGKGDRMAYWVNPVPRAKIGKGGSVGSCGSQLLGSTGGALLASMGLDRA